MNKNWKKFEQLTEKCYMNMIGKEKDSGCWKQAYESLREIVIDERSVQPDFAQELYQLDDATDYKYDVQGWLLDCLDELDMRQEYTDLLKMTDELLELFQWKEDSPSDIKFMKASALGALGRNEEAAEFCKGWLDEEPDTVVAISAAIYANMAVRNMKAVEALINEHIKEDTECTEDNDILFTAASTYYKITGNKKEKKRIDKAIKKYEEFLTNFYMGSDEDEDYFEMDEELPFI